MASNANSLRISGMNSGFDTESMVNALTASTKLKITKKERQVLKLQAQQDAYRDIISKMTGLQNKYFNTLNSSTNLKSTSLFSRYKSNLSINGSDTKPAGVTVTSGVNANAGTYKVKVNKVATRTTFTSKSLSSDTQIDLSQYSGADNDGKSFGMTITVGTKTKDIAFNGGASKDETIANINAALRDSFGTTNTGDGLVSINASGVFASADKSSVAISNVSNMKDIDSLDMSGLTTGKNTFTFRVGNETKTIAFQTISNDYFVDMYDENGAVKDANKKALYDQVRDDLYSSKSYDSYRNWLENATDDDKEALFQKMYHKAQQEQYQNSYDKAFTASKKTAYAEAVKSGAISDVEGEANYVSFDDWSYDFESTEDFTKFKTNYDENEKLDPDLYKAAAYSESKAYKELIFCNTLSKDDFDKTVTNQEIVNHYNKSNIRNSLEAVSFSDGTKLSVDFTESGDSITAANIKATKTTGEGDSAVTEDVKFSVTANAGSANPMGATIASTATMVASTTKLSELGLTPNADGKYTFTINGTKLEFDGDTTIKNMMKTVNESDAGVTMSFTTLTNNFTIASKEYGTGGTLTFEDGGEGLLAKLGINSATGTTTQGTNLEIEVNGEAIEAASNSFTVDGTTFTFSADSQGTEFTAEVARDYSDAIAAVKSFVEDYNQLIKDVYGYLDDKPKSDYYFLTDDDKEDMDLSDKQEEKWETMAKKGILYNDSSTSSIMSKLRTSLYQTTTLADGTKFGLFSMGVTTSDDWSKHGVLVLDEAKLTEAFETNADAIADLFTNKESGIMNQFNTALDSAVKTSGARKNKGILVQKAGVESTSSATDNSIYDEIKSLKKLISSLQDRYEKEQDRYWSKFSNMESALGSLNSQTSSLSQLMGQ